MATRSGGGTGVIVALVVFIITTVFLLVMTIVFYSNHNKSLEAQRDAEAALDKFITREQRGREETKRIEEAARAEGKSAFLYLADQVAALTTFVSGAAGTNINDARTQLKIDAGQTIKQAISTLRQDLATRDAEISSLNTRIQQGEQTLAALNTQMEQLRQSHARELQEVQGVIATYETASKGYAGEFANAMTTLDEAKRDIEQSYRENVATLQRQLDEVGQENAVLKTRVGQQQKALESIRVKAKNPAELVDGRVIDVAGSNDQVFLNIGAKDRVVLGMTFEVYDDDSSIRPSEDTGEYPRGKASVQVIKVADSTSTAKITRAAPGRPVVKDDVIANAIYDPDYKFKFLIHGNFDVDDDNRATPTETEYIRSQIVQWGGTVVPGDELVGDLDFLVLGSRPYEPSPLPANASEMQVSTWQLQREAFEKYHSLLDQANRAQIPVLNWNRLRVLTGFVNR